MKVKEFIKLLQYINQNAEIHAGNFRYYIQAGKNDPMQVNIDLDNFSLLSDDKDQERKYKKVKTCVLWMSE